MQLKSKIVYITDDGVELSEIQCETRNKYLKLLEDKEFINKNIELLQNSCEHINNIIAKGNDHDGYSIVDITYITTYKCLVCDKITKEERTSCY